MKVIVVGAGKVGFYLAKTLLEHGHIPLVVEIDPVHCRQAADELGIPVTCGDGSSADTLRAAGAETADAIVSAKRDWNDRPKKDQRMKKVTVDTQGVDYPAPEKV